MKKIQIVSKAYGSQMGIDSIHNAIQGYKNIALRQMIKLSMPKEGNVLLKNLDSVKINDSPLTIEITHKDDNIKLVQKYCEKMLASFRATKRTYSMVVIDDGK